MSIGGSCQDVLSGAQNHLDGLRNDCEGRGVPVPPPPNLDFLKQRESLRHMVKSFSVLSGFDFRHFSIMPVLAAAGRVEVWESKWYMSSGSDPADQDLSIREIGRRCLRHEDAARIKRGPRGPELLQEVATDEVREANRSRASGSPLPGEGTG